MENASSSNSNGFDIHEENLTIQRASTLFPTVFSSDYLDSRYQTASPTPTTALNPPSSSSSLQTNSNPYTKSFPTNTMPSAPLYTTTNNLQFPTNFTNIPPIQYNSNVVTNLEKEYTKPQPIYRQPTSTPSKSKSPVDLQGEVNRLEEIEFYRNRVQQKTNEQNYKKNYFNDEEMLEKEIEKLKSNEILLQQRIQALQEIIQVQTKHLEENRNNSRTQTEQSLLQKWREKVFALMVQNKSSDLAQEKLNHEMKEEHFQLQSKLSEVEREKLILEQREADLKASLQLETTAKVFAQTTSKKLSMREKLLCEDIDQFKQFNSRFLMMLQTFSQNYNITVQNVMEHMGVLDAFDKRIEFAKGRLGIVNGLFEKRVTKMKTKMNSLQEENVSLKSKVAELTKHEEDRKLKLTNSVIESMQNEIRKLYADREMLLSHYKSETDGKDKIFKQMETQYQQQKSKYEEAIVHLSRRNKEHETELEKSRQVIESQATKLHEAEQALHHEINRFRDFRALLKTVKEETQSKYEKKIVEETTKLHSELNKLQSSNNVLRTTMLQQENVIRQLQQKLQQKESELHIAQNEKEAISMFNLEPKPTIPSSIPFEAAPLVDHIDQLTKNFSKYLNETDS